MKRKMKNDEYLNSSETTIRNYVQELREKGTGHMQKRMKKVKKATAWRRDRVAASSVSGQCHPGLEQEPQEDVQVLSGIC